MLVELVAVVPSVVFGLWGIAVLIPFLGHYVSPTGNGYGLLAARHRTGADDHADHRLDAV